MANPRIVALETPMGDFRKLIAWQKAHRLSVAIHAAFNGRKTAASYPGLRAQVLRAASSISMNLAEGCAKRSRRELARYAEMAYASAKEVDSALLIARDTAILPRQVYDDLAKQTDAVARLCFALTRSE